MSVSFFFQCHLTLISTCSPFWLVKYTTKERMVIISIREIDITGAEYIIYNKENPRGRGSSSRQTFNEKAPYCQNAP